MKKIWFLFLFSLLLTACNPLSQPKSSSLSEQTTEKSEQSSFEKDFEEITSAFGWRVEKAIESPLQRQDTRGRFSNPSAKKLVISGFLHPGKVYDYLETKRTFLQEQSEANGILWGELMFQKGETICKIRQYLLLDSLTEAEVAELYEQGYVNGKDPASHIEIHCWDASAPTTRKLDIAWENLKVGDKIGNMTLEEKMQDADGVSFRLSGNQKIKWKLVWRKYLPEEEGLQVFFTPEMLNALLRIPTPEGDQNIISLFEWNIPLESFDPQTRQALLWEVDLFSEISLQAFTYESNPDGSIQTELSIGEYKILDED